GKGKLPDFVSDAGSLQLLLGLANACDFRCGIDDGGNGVVVDMSGAAGDALGTSHRFVFSLVREHGTFAAIADRPDARDVGGEMCVGHDAAMPIERNTDLVQSQTVDVGAPPDGYEHDIGLE